LDEATAFDMRLVDGQWEPIPDVLVSNDDGRAESDRVALEWRNGGAVAREIATDCNEPFRWRGRPFAIKPRTGDFSEEPAWGCELVTLETVDVPRCPPGPVIAAVASSAICR
jgi:hypothetical protein